MEPSINDFFKRFGKNTTSNIQLINFANQLKMKPFKVIMRDETKLVTNKDYVIGNIHESSEKGVHWYCFHDKYFFDSYGLPPCNEVKEKISPGIYSEFNIQTFEQKFCGTICFYVLYMMYKGNSFEDVVLYLYKIKEKL